MGETNTPRRWLNGSGPTKPMDPSPFCRPAITLEGLHCGRSYGPRFVKLRSTNAQKKANSVGSVEIVRHWGLPIPMSPHFKPQCTRRGNGPDQTPNIPSAPQAPQPSRRRY